MERKVPWSAAFKKEAHSYHIDKPYGSMPQYEKDHIFSYSGVMRSQLIRIEVSPQEECWYIVYSGF